MKKLIQQEFWKLVLKPSFYISIFIISISSFIMAWICHTYPERFLVGELFASNFGVFPLIAIFVIYVSSISVSQEYEFNTFKFIIATPFSRKKILISKVITSIILIICTYLFSMLLSLLYKFIFFPDINLNTMLTNSHLKLWSFWIINGLSNFITLFMIVSVVFLTSTFINKGAVSAIVGIVGYFLLSAFGTIMFQLINHFPFLRWNPINMLNLPQQISFSNSYEKLTLLTTQELIVGNIIYSVIFLSLAVILFSNKEA